MSAAPQQDLHRVVVADLQRLEQHNRRKGETPPSAPHPLQWLLVLTGSGTIILPSVSGFGSEKMVDMQQNRPHQRDTGHCPASRGGSTNVRVCGGSGGSLTLTLTLGTMLDPSGVLPGWTISPNCSPAPR